MKRYILTLLVGAILLPSVVAQTIQYNSGEPQVVINYSNWLNGTVTFNRLGYVSGVAGTGPERWTATAFEVVRPITFDRVVGDTFSAGGEAFTISFKIYMNDGPGGAPGTEVAGGTTTYDFRSYTHPAGYFVDQRVVIPTGNPVTLQPGIYWITVYGDYTLAWFTGSPLSPVDTHNFRRPGPVGGPWTINTATVASFRMPPYGPGGTGPLQNPAANWDYGGDCAVRPGQIWKTSFELVNTQETGGRIRGQMALDGWPLGPNVANPYGVASAMWYAALLIDPATGKTMGVHTFQVNADGTFEIPQTNPGSATPRQGDIPPGTYDVLVRSAYAVYFSQGTPITGIMPATHHWLGKKVASVVVTAGGTADLGTLTLKNGDTNADCKVDDRDVANVLKAHGSTSAEPFTSTQYRFSIDTDNDGTVGDPDVNKILGNFGAVEG